MVVVVVFVCFFVFQFEHFDHCSLLMIAVDGREKDVGIGVLDGIMYIKGGQWHTSHTLC